MIYSFHLGQIVIYSLSTPEVYRFDQKRPMRTTPGSMTVEEVNDLLDELAKQQKEVAKREQREKSGKQGEKESKRDKSYHFVVLPTGLGQILGGAEHWESVPIAGVDDEVAAHCGLFIRGQNLDYDGLLERVGRKVLEICDKA